MAIGNTLNTLPTAATEPAQNTKDAGAEAFQNILDFTDGGIKTAAGPVIGPILLKQLAYLFTALLKGGAIVGGAFAIGKIAEDAILQRKLDLPDKGKVTKSVQLQQDEKITLSYPNGSSRDVQFKKGDFVLFYEGKVEDKGNPWNPFDNKTRKYEGFAVVRDPVGQHLGYPSGTTSKVLFKHHEFQK